MRLVFIYGAPAVGKRTVGGELAALTGWPLHHDHMAADLAVALFEFDDPHFLRLRHRLHLDTLEAAAAANLPGLVFAYCVGGAWDDPFLAEVVARFGEHACFVKLTCSPEEQRRRVVSPDRGRFRKMTDPGALRETLEAVDFSRTVEHPNHLALETSRLSAREAAAAIARRFDLPQESRPGEAP